MKKNISILLAVIGVFAGRALARQGNATLEVIVLSLIFLVILAFGIYVYKKTHNRFLPLGCLLLGACLPVFNMLLDGAKTSNTVVWAIISALLFVLFLAVGCMFTGAHQIAPQNISHKQWKYYLMALAGLWIVCCGGLAALTFL